jgi:hypothetical protein
MSIERSGVDQEFETSFLLKKNILAVDKKTNSACFGFQLNPAF